MNQKGFSAVEGVIIGLVILSGVAIGGVLVLKNEKAWPAIKDGTANWKIYKGDKFEFKYPPNMYIHNGPRKDWVLLAQTSEPPKFGFEITCYFPSDHINVIFQGDTRALISNFNTPDGFSKILEDNYIADGGKKVFDKIVDNLRMVKFDQARVFGSKFILFSGYSVYDMSQEKCGGGDIPFDQITNTLKPIVK